MKCPRGQSGGVSAKYQTEAFISRPRIAIPDGAKVAVLMDTFNALPVLFVVSWLIEN